MLQTACRERVALDQHMELPVGARCGTGCRRRHKCCRSSDMTGGCGDLLLNDVRSSCCWPFRAAVLRVIIAAHTSPQVTDSNTPHTALSTAVRNTCLPGALCRCSLAAGRAPLGALLSPLHRRPAAWRLLLLLTARVTCQMSGHRYRSWLDRKTDSWKPGTVRPGCQAGTCARQVQANYASTR